jgi:hypothetical protein
MHFPPLTSRRRHFLLPVVLAAKNRAFQRCCRICGDISCQLLAPGGSMGPRYVLQLLFSEKSQDRLKTEHQQARGQISTDLKSLEF